jgi:hypothetical protein
MKNVPGDKMKYTQLCTNYGGNPMSFVATNITAVVTSTDWKESKTDIWVIGSDKPFKCSESYDTIRVKLDACLE